MEKQMEKQIVAEIVKDLKQTNKFKAVYNNIIPVWTEVKDFPAIGVVYDSDVRKTYTQNTQIVNATVLILIYNKQKNSNYDDNLTDLVDVVKTVVKNNNFLRCSTIESIISSFKRDGGFLMPYSVAQLVLSVTYKIT
jgi:hypothetical protein